MKFLRQADMILATSTQYCETSAVLARLRDRCRVIPLGILPEAFREADPAHVQALRQRYGGGYVLFSGRHRYYKGVEYLVRAARAIRAPVVAAGDGPERARCMALAKTLGVHVEFPGTLTHEALVAHLHGCDVFVFPSVERSEAFGLSILEAHACGKPVVATCLGTGVEYVNQDGRTGVNVAPRDPEALAEAVNRLIEAPDRRHAMGACARARVETEFHAEHVARAEFDAYSRTMEGP